MTPLARFAVVCGVLLAAADTLRGQEPVSPAFPAVIRVQSSEADEDGRLNIELNLEIEKNVDLWANPVGSDAMKHAAATVTLTDREGNLIPAAIEYPKGEKVTNKFLGTFHVYRKRVKIKLRTDAAVADRARTVRCKVAGYDRERGACLGIRELEAELR